MELVHVEAQHGDMRSVLLHGRHRVAQKVVERLAIGQAGEGVMSFEIAQTCFGLEPLAAARPDKRDRGGYPGAEQQQGHAGDEAEITGERVSLFALVEVDDERSISLAAQMSRNGEDRKMRHGGIRAVAQRDGGFCAWKHARSAVHARIECQSRLDAREAEVAGMVIELVQKHAMVIAELLEETAQMRRESRARERIGKGAGLPVQLGSD